MKITLPLICAALLSCAAQRTSSQNGSSDLPTRPEIAEVRRLLRAGETDEALAITDRLLKVDDEDREARLLAAQGNIALFESGRTDSQWFLEDAIANLRQALDIERDDPSALVSLSWCLLQQREFDEGRDVAFEAADLLQERTAPADRVAGALMQAAENQMQILIEARRAEIEAGEPRPTDESEQYAQDVLKTLAMVASTAPNPTAVVREAQVFQWTDHQVRALRVLEAGVEQNPDAHQIHDALQQTYWRMNQQLECVGFYKQELKSKTGNAALVWYLGRAQVALADQHRTGTRWSQAATIYADALATYERYDGMQSRNHTLTAQWLAICELSLGRVRLEMGDLAAAEQHFELAFERDPGVAENDEAGFPRIYDSFGGNFVGGLALLGQAIIDNDTDQGLRRSLEFYDRVIARHPDRFGSIYNNAALSARDLGVAVVAAATDADRTAADAEAMALWEKSYRYYEKAVELEPGDARIVNDCGLMLIYHLHRDYDRARQLFDRAAELGEADLNALPSDAETTRREFLEEATGDAYQNIGVLLVDRLGRPTVEARPFFAKAIRFYPYQRREAAERLRAMDQDPEAGRREQARAERFRPVDQEARALAAAGDYDAALLVLDKVAREMADHAPFKFVYGMFSLRLGEQLAERGGDGGLITGLFQDAERNLRRAVELDGEPLEPRLELARAQLANGDVASAATTADELLSHARSIGASPSELLLAAHKVRAEANARLYVAAKSDDGTEDEERLRTARTSFRHIEETAVFDATARTLWTTLEQWAGAPEQAVAIMVRASSRDPQLIGEMVDLAGRVNHSELALEALAGAEDATGLWYRGKASFDRAQQQWAGGETGPAIATLDAGIASFEAAATANQDYAESCQQWIALSTGSRGLIQFAANDVAGARESLLAAARLRPDVVGNDLGGGASIRRGVLLVGDRYYQAEDLKSSESLYREATAAVPDDAQFANNHGLFARDYGNQLERDGDAATATEMYAASYASYTRAQTLSPDDLRLRNDRALLLVYHLHTELDVAKALLESTITDGERRLQESPPTDSNALFDLRESVGDAYENLGYYQAVHARQFAAARQSYQKSLEFPPDTRQRTITMRLRQLAELEKTGGGS